MSLAGHRTRGGRGERREDIREQLLEVVEDLVTSGDSYASMTVDRLVAAAGLSRATFYIYFEDKGDLLRAWLHTALEDVGAACVDWRRLPVEPSQEQLFDALLPIVHTYRQHSSLMAAVLDEATKDSSLRGELDRATQTAAAALSQHIAARQQNGSIGPRLLPRETAEWLICMFERALTDIAATATDEETNALLKSLSDIGWHILYAPDEPVGGG